MQKFREKIMRKFHEKLTQKNKTKISREKNENYAKKTQTFGQKIHSLIVLVERMYCGRTDRNLKR